MKLINVTLRHSTPLEIGEWAVSFPYEHEPDAGRFERVVGVKKHYSEAEFLEYWFAVRGISRLCLQELARHRIGVSLSVQSTRYTIRKAVKAWEEGRDLKTFYVACPDEEIAGYQAEDVSRFLERASYLLGKGKKQDDLKYLLPECWRTQLGWKLNARALYNMLELRLGKTAHYEIKTVAAKMMQLVPANQRFMYTALEEKATEALARIS